MSPEFALTRDRTLLATLDHKPWPAEDGRPWTAAFPWEGDAPDVASLQLAVTPSIVVPLGGEPAGAPARPPDEVRARRITDHDERLAAARAQRDEALAERDAALAARDQAVRERDALAQELHERERADARVEEVARRLADAEDERDRALAQPAGVAAPVPVQRVAREHAQESTRADWAARIAALPRGAGAAGPVRHLREGAGLRA